MTKEFRSTNDERPTDKRPPTTFHGTPQAAAYDLSIWYMLKGMFTPMIEITSSLETKMHKIASEIGKNTLKAMGYTSWTTLNVATFTNACCH